MNFRIITFTPTSHLGVLFLFVLSILFSCSLTAQVTAGKTYTIESKARPGQYIDVNGATAEVGDNVSLYWLNPVGSNLTNQHFRFIEAGGGYYYIASVQNDRLVLDVSNWGKNDGTNISIVRRGNGTSAQKFRLMYGDRGYIKIVSAMRSDLFVGIADDNVNIVIRVGDRGDRTQFRLFPIGQIKPSAPAPKPADEWLAQATEDVAVALGNGAHEVGAWFVTAGSDIKNELDYVFNGPRVAAPNRGVAPNEPPKGVRKYVLTIFHVTNRSSGSDGQGDIELYGSINAIPNGKVYTNRGANQFLFNKRPGDRIILDTGKHYSKTEHKTFYVKDADAPGASINLISRLMEHDDFDNDHVYGAIRIDLGNLPVGHYKESDFIVRSDSNDREVVRILYAIRRSK